MRQETRLEFHVALQTLLLLMPAVGSALVERGVCSAIGQGTHIKRHKPSKPAAVPGTGGPFRPADFLVGGTFTLYDRTFHLVDADAYTRCATPPPCLDGAFAV